LIIKTKVFIYRWRDFQKVFEQNKIQTSNPGANIKSLQLSNYDLF